MKKKWLKLSPKWLHELRVTTQSLHHSDSNPHTQIITYHHCKETKGQLKHVTQNITSIVDNFNPKCSSTALHYINFKIGCQKQSFLSCEVAFSHVLRGSSLYVETAPNCQVSKLEFLQNFWDTYLALTLRVRDPNSTLMPIKMQKLLLVILWKNTTILPKQALN